MKHKKRALFQSVVALILCLSMLVGTTFAWFTDSVSSGINTIAAGNLDVELYHSNAVADGEPVKEDTSLFLDLQGNPILWEPGAVSYENLRVTNAGDLALAYQLAIATDNENFVVETSGAQYGLSQILKVGVVRGGITATDRRGVVESVADADWTTLSGFVHNGSLLPEGEGTSEEIWGVVIYWEPGEFDNYWNLNNGKTLSSGEVLSIDLGISLIATQEAHEVDAFGSDYDSTAAMDVFPVFVPAGSTTTTVVPDADNKVASDVVMTAGQISAAIPAGVKLAAGTTALTMSVSEMGATSENIVVSAAEASRSLDVHIEGVDSANTVPMEISIPQTAPKGLNLGNLTLYHVENGTPVEMTLVAQDAAFTDHNQFKYDPATGNIVLYMATFSEVALVAETAKAWEGKFDYTWYDASKTELTIANADQLAAFGAIVGGMNGQTQDSFAGKIVKLIADINLGDKEAENNPDVIFYPIGYYNSEGTYERTNTAITSGLRNFEGTFDGQGHSISNFYHNTWEMKGDHKWYSPEEQYYCDGMGLFGRVYGGIVKNLTVKNFSSDGEIATTGVIAAYADGATFENISIFNCNPRVYNIGNGGIVGCVGWYAKEADLTTIFKNITVDNSNKISALWGSYDVACGGIVGQYYPTSGQTSAGTPKNAGIDLVNCHVSAIMDVYNDVCANYQYYAYRYAGMMIGSIRENTTNKDGKTIPNMTGISATGCTVNYGDWNDYYYCEFEKNGHPSYSGPNDYKFSRVPHSELNFADSNGNGLVDKDERASVTGCKHTHTAKENHQAVYLPFHQLFTGYGWGVNSIGLEKYSGIVTNLDITEGDQQESVEKFKVKLSADTTLPDGEAISIGDLFSAIDGAEINGAAVQVSVSALNDSGIVGTYSAGSDGWDSGTLTLNKTGGMCIVTIQDYNFCKPTSFMLKDGKLYNYSKFKTVFTGNFLYRVGNANPVALSSLFTASSESVGEVSVSIKTEQGNAAGTYTANASEWGKGTIQFSGTGKVTVTIQDEAVGSLPVELKLEVVDATNVTSASEWENDTTCVLLNGITLTSEKRITGNNTLYGNGFTIDATGAPYRGVTYDYQSYVIYLENSKLDNVIIQGLVYPEIGGTKSDDYSRALVMTNGNCKITGSFLSNTASPIRNGGNLELKDSTLFGGAYANLDIRNGHTILDNVTTVNQFDEEILTSSGKEVVGLGIVIYQEGGSEELKITIRNKLTQHNIISKEQVASLEGYAATFVKEIFTNDAFKNYQFASNGTAWVNTGIISMNNYFTEEDLVDERPDKKGYTATAAKVSLLTQERNCLAYSYTPTSGNTSSGVKPGAGTQGVVEPSAVFDFENKNYIAKTDGSNDYCYEDSGTVYISMDEGDTFIWDPSILTVTKNGQALEYTVKMGEIDYTGKSIKFSEKGDYTVEYSYTDPYNYTNDKSYEVPYTKTLHIDVVIVGKGAQNAVFSFGANGTAYSGKTVIIGDKTYVMPDVSATVSGKIGSKTVNGTTVYYPITEMYTSDGKTAHTGSWYACFPIFKDAVQIIDYADKGIGDPVTYNQTNVTKVDQIPATLKAVDPKTAFLYSMNATNYPPPTDPTAVSGAVCYTCNRNGLTASNTRKEESTVAEYTYTDNAGKVYYYYIGYHCAEQTKGSISPCVTPDTLITLADGTQKRIDAVTHNDKLLVWDFFKGEYAAVPAAIIFDHGFGNNTVIKLNFSDGTTVKVTNLHQFYNADLNKFVSIDAESVAQYVGHSFAKQGGKTVKLENYSISQEYVEAYGIISAQHYNIFVEGMISTDFMVEDYDLFNYFEFGKDMKFDPVKMQTDIETYGLYTYEEFADYLTYEQFVAFNVPYMKVAVGKGNYTYEGILNLIDEYLSK